MTEEKRLYAQTTGVYLKQIADIQICVNHLKRDIERLTNAGIVTDDAGFTLRHYNNLNNQLTNLTMNQEIRKQAEDRKRTEITG